MNKNIHLDPDDYLNHVDHTDHVEYDDHIDHETQRICKEVGSCTQASQKLSDLM